MNKYTPCSWCDRKAWHNLGTSDAACAFHYALYFAKHTSLLSRLDMPSRAGRAGGKHRKVVAR